MLKKNFMWVIVGIVLSLGIVTFTLFNKPVDAALGEEDAIRMIEERFYGTVKKIDAVKIGGHPHYEMEFHSPYGVYFIQLDSVSGDIKQLDQIGNPEDIPITERPKESSPIGIDQTRQIINESIAADSRIIEVDLQELDNQLVYYVTVELSDGIGRFELDALTGEVLLYTLESREVTPTEPIGEDQAIDIALGEFAGKIDDIDLEEENGRLVYKIEIENDDLDIEANIVLDAYTGEVLSVEYD